MAIPTPDRFRFHTTMRACHQHEHATKELAGWHAEMTLTIRKSSLICGECRNPMPTARSSTQSQFRFPLDPWPVASSLSTFLLQHSTTPRDTNMNKYGAQAQKYWMTQLPSRYAELDDPQEFFTELGEELEAEIVDYQTAMERQLDPELPYLEKVAHLRMIQKRAEELVFTEVVWSQVPETTSLEHYRTQLILGMPSAEGLTEHIQDIELNVLMNNDLEEAPNQSVTELMNSDELHRYTTLVKLRDVVTPYQNPDEVEKLPPEQMKPLWDEIQQLLAVLP